MPSCRLRYRNCSSALLCSPSPILIARMRVRISFLPPLKPSPAVSHRAWRLHSGSLNCCFHCPAPGISSHRTVRHALKGAGSRERSPLAGNPKKRWQWYDRRFSASPSTVTLCRQSSQIGMPVSKSRQWPARRATFQRSQLSSVGAVVAETVDISPASKSLEYTAGFRTQSQIFLYDGHASFAALKVFALKKTVT